MQPVTPLLVAVAVSDKRPVFEPIGFQVLLPNDFNSFCGPQSRENSGTGHSTTDKGRPRRSRRLAHQHVSHVGYWKLLFQTRSGERRNAPQRNGEKSGPRLAGNIVAGSDPNWRATGPPQPKAAFLGPRWRGLFPKEQSKSSEGSLRG